VYLAVDMGESVDMAWLLRDGQVLASLEIAESFLDRSRGLLGRKGCEGAMLLRHTRGVHSFGMRFDMDVAWLDADHVVLGTKTLRKYSLALPRLRARSVLEAEKGAFARWELKEGDRLEIKQ
jgi:uncharacterized membrane protein (UPF0127 family)